MKLIWMVQPKVREKKITNETQEQKSLNFFLKKLQKKFEKKCIPPLIFLYFPFLLLFLYIFFSSNSQETEHSSYCLHLFHLTLSIFLGRDIVVGNHVQVGCLPSIFYPSSSIFLFIYSAETLDARGFLRANIIKITSTGPKIWIKSMTTVHTQ